MPKRPLPKPPKFEKIPPILEPPQVESPDEVKRPKAVDRADQRIGQRPKRDDSLRGQPGGEFISPYLHNMRKDPSRQRRDDREQLDFIRELQEKKKEINEQLRELRIREGGVNPYNVHRDSEELFGQMLADLRNMEQSPYSGNLSGKFGYSPLHRMFMDQFTVSEDNDDNVSS